MRFGLISLPGGRQDVLRDAALAQEAGFDVLATGDHIRHPRQADFALLDGWSVLAAWAVIVENLRIAMLVSNIVYRHPTVLAKQAVTVDQLSGGRLDLGIGAGVYPTDHAMSGVPMWTSGERVARLREFVGALDSALKGESSFEGAYYRFDDAAVEPRSVQQPRPPIVVGAVGPRMLRVTTEIADVWSAFGGMALADEEEFLSAVAQQTAFVDRHCDAIGRDPRSLRRSLLAFRPLNPWRRRGSLERLADYAHRLGFDELILYKPASASEQRVFDDVVSNMLPALRAD